MTNIRQIIRQLIQEGIQEDTALDFISKTIKGTEWENHVFLAGGAVRDEIMGKEIKDLDLVVDLPNGGILFAKWITKHTNCYKANSNPVIFPRFGTAKFQLYRVIHNGIDISNIQIEAVMTRKEKYTSGSRKPDVTPGTLKQDVERRDFTVNSLLKNLTNNEILDLTGIGKDDIKRGLLRTPLDPDIIFSEDPLRQLRIIRFCVKYDWDIPMFMIKALKRNASKLQFISDERIQDELSKILVSKNPDKGIRLLQMTGLMKYIAPEYNELKGLTQNKYHKDTADKHTLEVLKNVPPKLVTRLSAWLHDIGKAKTKEVIDNETHFYKHEEVSAYMAKKILQKLKYPNDIIDQVVLNIREHMRLKGAGKQGEIISDKALRKLKMDIGEHLNDLLDLIHADNSSHSEEHSLSNQIPAIRKRLANIKDISKEKSPLPISGNDIMQAFNLKPGKEIGRLLKIIENAWLENPDLTKEEAIEILKKEI